VSSCETEADKSEEFKRDAERCQNCLSAADSCTESLPCAKECMGVVPEVVL
jgi:hypothetical protein